MSGEPRLFKVEKSNWELLGLNEVDFSDLDVQERKDIQEWVAANPNILGENLLFVGKEFSGFDRTRERPDLLAVDSAGRLVVVELKRDDSGTDVHWQAIKYASYLREANAKNIVGMLSDYEGIDEEQAERRLIEHIGSDDTPSVLNNDQRIILVSHRFPPEVTSAALWLNDKASRSLVTCVTLTPYIDGDQALHVLASTIIPVPGEAGFKVGLGTSERLQGQESVDLRYRNRHDGVSDFLHGVAEGAKNLVSNEVKPDKTSRWAGGHAGWRYYHFWYAREPWRNWYPAYRIEMYPEINEHPAQIDNAWTAWVGFVAGPAVGDEIDLASFDIHEDQELRDGGIWVCLKECDLTNDLADQIANLLAKFITAITPVIDDLGNERG